MMIQLMIQENVVDDDNEENVVDDDDNEENVVDDDDNEENVVDDDNEENVVDDDNEENDLTIKTQLTYCEYEAYLYFILIIMWIVFSLHPGHVHYLCVFYRSRVSLWASV